MSMQEGAKQARCQGATEGARNPLISAIGLYSNYTYNTNYTHTYNSTGQRHRAPSGAQRLRTCEDSLEACVTVSGPPGMDARLVGADASRRRWWSA